MLIGSERLLITLGIFFASLAVILVRPKGISEAAGSVAGAAAMVAAGLVPVSQAAQLLRDSWNILLFFTGLVLVAWATEQSGFFRWAALWAARLARGDARRLLINVFMLGVLISTFLSNDATALLLTPVVIALASETGLPALPLALTCTFIADTASVSLPVSNPINVLLLDQFRGIHLAAYLDHLLIPSLAAIAINLLVFLFLFRRETVARFDVALLPRPASVLPHRGYFRYVLVCLGILAVAYIVISSLGGPISVVALGGAALLVAGGVICGRLPATELRRAPWTILPFIAGLLVLVQSLENAGVTAWLGNLLVAASTHGRFAGVGAALVGGAAGSNLINNVPMATVLAAAIRHAQLSSVALHDGLVYAALFGCDIGPNLTILGSLSTLLWLVLLRKRGIRVTSWQYIRTGLIVTPPMLLAGLVLIALIQ